MPGEAPRRKPRFHAAVVSSYGGGDAPAAAFAARLASTPASGVGVVVESFTAGSNCVAVAPTWRAGVGSGAASASLSFSSNGSSAPKPPAPKRRRTAPPGGAEVPGGDEDGVLGEDALVAAAVAHPRRLRRPSARRDARSPFYAQVKVVLGACVRRACRLPSSTPVGKRMLPVSASLVGDPLSRSRAILLRVGNGKGDSAILWASHRGGLLCSCFSGTQNALFLSASSRSTACKHTSALRSSLCDSKIPVAKFCKRMHLGPNAADFAVNKQYGSSISWIVLYRSVYSLVSFSSGNVGTCIAPSCRRFRSRCGHVTFVRPLHYAHRAAAVADPELEKDTGVGRDVGASSLAHTGRDLPLVPALDGVPTETQRCSTDAVEAVVAARVQRNMLPCSGEIAAGDVWARTADWRGLFLGRFDGPDDGRLDDFKRMTAIMNRGVTLGVVHSTRQTFVEAY